jgi:hypothetical protein
MRRIIILLFICNSLFSWGQDEGCPASGYKKYVFTISFNGGGFMTAFRVKGYKGLVTCLHGFLATSMPEPDFQNYQIKTIYDCFGEPIYYYDSKSDKKIDTKVFKVDSIDFSRDIAFIKVEDVVFKNYFRASTGKYDFGQNTAGFDISTDSERKYCLERDNNNREYVHKGEMYTWGDRYNIPDICPEKITYLGIYSIEHYIEKIETIEKVMYPQSFYKGLSIKKEAMNGHSGSPVLCRHCYKIISLLVFRKNEGYPEAWTSFFSMDSLKSYKQLTKNDISYLKKSRKFILENPLSYNTKMKNVPKTQVTAQSDTSSDTSTQTNNNNKTQKKAHNDQRYLSLPLYNNSKTQKKARNNQKYKALKMSLPEKSGNVNYYLKKTPDTYGYLEVYGGQINKKKDDNYKTAKNNMEIINKWINDCKDNELTNSYAPKKSKTKFNNTANLCAEFKEFKHTKQFVKVVSLFLSSKSDSTLKAEAQSLYKLLYDGEIPTQKELKVWKKYNRDFIEEIENLLDIIANEFKKEEDDSLRFNDSLYRIFIAKADNLFELELYDSAYFYYMEAIGKKGFEDHPLNQLREIRKREREIQKNNLESYMEVEAERLKNTMENVKTDMYKRYSALFYDNMPKMIVDGINVSLGDSTNKKASFSIKYAMSDTNFIMNAKYSDFPLGKYRYFLGDKCMEIIYWIIETINKAYQVSDSGIIVTYIGHSDGTGFTGDLIYENDCGTIEKQDIKDCNNNVVGRYPKDLRGDSDAKNRALAFLRAYGAKYVLEKLNNENKVNIKPNPEILIETHDQRGGEHRYVEVKLEFEFE